MHTLILVNLGACCLIAFSTLWLVTDQSEGRLVRIFLALIMCGAMINAFALWEAFHVVHDSHPLTWPTETVLNLGEAMLLANWVLHRRRRLPSPA